LPFRSWGGWFHVLGGIVPDKGVLAIGHPGPHPGEGIHRPTVFTSPATATAPTTATTATLSIIFLIVAGFRCDRGAGIVCAGFITTTASPTTLATASIAVLTILGIGLDLAGTSLGHWAIVFIAIFIVVFDHFIVDLVQVVHIIIGNVLIGGDIGFDWRVARNGMFRTGFAGRSFDFVSSKADIVIKGNGDE